MAIKTGLERYPEFEPLVTELVNDIFKKILEVAWEIESEMPYKAMFVLEEIIKKLEEKV